MGENYVPVFSFWGILSLEEFFLKCRPRFLRVNSVSFEDISLRDNFPEVISWKTISLISPLRDNFPRKNCPSVNRLACQVSCGGTRSRRQAQNILSIVQSWMLTFFSHRIFQSYPNKRLKNDHQKQQKVTMYVLLFVHLYRLITFSAKQTKIPHDFRKKPN